MSNKRTVAMIDVADYPRTAYSAYWTIDVKGNDLEGWQWRCSINSYEPTGWSHNGKLTAERPDFPWPQYPDDMLELPGGRRKVSQAEYADMDEEKRAHVFLAQEKRRKQIKDIYDSHPQPVFACETAVDVTRTRDEADTAAQKWAIEHMQKYARKSKASTPSAQGGYAMPLGPAGMLLEAAEEFLRWVFGPLLALSYSTTIRTNRITQVLNAIDGGAGAGLWRIYDGSRPATCGTATTLLAEITLQDPSGTVGSQQLTFDNTPGMTDSSANATGTASWFRIVDSTATCCVDGNVGTSGSDLNLNSTSINSGVEVTITSAVITEGNA